MHQTVVPLPRLNLALTNMAGFSRTRLVMTWVSNAPE